MNKFSFELKATMNINENGILSLTDPIFKITAISEVKAVLDAIDAIQNRTEATPAKGDIKQQYEAKLDAQNKATFAEIKLIRKALGIEDTIFLDATDDMVVIQIKDEGDGIGDHYGYPNTSWIKPLPAAWVGELKLGSWYVCHAVGYKHSDIQNAIEVLPEAAYRINKYYHQITATYQKANLK